MNKFKQTIERKKARLEELALQPLGRRFLHHTILGTPESLRSSIAYTIVKNGLLNSKDRRANPETAFKASNTWFDDDYQPVYLFDDSYNSFRVGSDGIQLMDVIVDPKILETRKHSRTTSDSKDLFDSYQGEIGVYDSIEPEHILGAIVPTEGHNVLLELQKKPRKNPEELEQEDKARYKSFERSYKGGIWESDENGRNVGIPAFYRGLVWGMKDLPENAFPVFTGFGSSHFPYLAASHLWTGQQATPEDEIPFEFYLAGQIFPLTPQAYFGQIMRDIAEKQNVSPRDFGLGIRCGKGLITPEQALGREMTEEEKQKYQMVTGGRK
ncbi:MAG: hypothetical protein ACTSX6_11155 [Candidatus Heimdallarchaeaceae archaeon]